MILLPLTLENMSLRSCFFSGTLDMGQLPPHLESFTSRHNKISGLCNMRNLPQSLGLIEVLEYAIKSDEIYVGRLPDTGIRIRLRRFTKMSFDNPSDSRKVVFIF